MPTAVAGLAHGESVSRLDEIHRCFWGKPKKKAVTAHIPAPSIDIVGLADVTLSYSGPPRRSALTRQCRQARQQTTLSARPD